LAKAGRSLCYAPGCLAQLPCICPHHWDLSLLVDKLVIGRLRLRQPAPLCWGNGGKKCLRMDMAKSMDLDMTMNLKELHSYEWDKC
jgi:hypothetical protein